MDKLANFFLFLKFQFFFNFLKYLAAHLLPTIDYQHSIVNGFAIDLKGVFYLKKFAYIFFSLLSDLSRIQQAEVLKKKS